MARYFIHCRGATTLIDAEPYDRPDLEHMRREAVAAARELIAAAAMDGLPVPDDYFEITDERGSVLMVLPFKDALDGTPLDHKFSPRPWSVGRPGSAPD